MDEMDEPEVVCRCGGGNSDPMEPDPDQKVPGYVVYRCVTCSHEILIRRMPASE